MPWGDVAGVASAAEGEVPEVWHLGKVKATLPLSCLQAKIKEKAGAGLAASSLLTAEVEVAGYPQ